jgi:hypothetical protein
MKPKVSDSNESLPKPVLLYSDWWFGTFSIFHILGMSSSQVTFILFFGGGGQPPTRFYCTFICIWRMSLWPMTTINIIREPLDWGLLLRHRKRGEDFPLNQAIDIKPNSRPSSSQHSYGCKTNFSHMIILSFIIWELLLIADDFGNAGKLIQLGMVPSQHFYGCHESPERFPALEAPGGGARSGERPSNWKAVPHWNHQRAISRYRSLGTALEIPRRLDDCPMGNWT